MKDRRNATFLDLCSFCPNPRRKTYTSLIANVHKRSTVGWSTANVVDCYDARTSELCNSLGESISFGCIESCIVVQMLCEKNIKMLTKHLQELWPHKRKQCVTMYSCHCCGILMFLWCGMRNWPINWRYTILWKVSTQICFLLFRKN